jgi:hypothetical protein
MSVTVIVSILHHVIGSVSRGVIDTSSLFVYLNWIVIRECFVLYDFFSSIEMCCV